jgi:serine/threonine protein kinase
MGCASSHIARVGNSGSDDSSCSQPSKGGSFQQFSVVEISTTQCRVASQLSDVVPTVPPKVSQLHHDSPYREFHSQYHLGHALGKGAFAVVFAAVKMHTKRQSGAHSDVPLGHVVAVKVIQIASTEQKKAKTDQRHAKQEASNWNAIGSHPNCVCLYEMFMDKYYCYMVMEKCDKTLLRHLETMPSLDERSLGALCCHILSGVAHCHDFDIAHLDIKPDNFLVGGEDGQVVKLGDFGVSTFIPKHNQLTHRKGTVPYMCPEMVLGKQYDEKADTWSVGVVVYVLLFGLFPYMPTKQSSKGMMEAIAQGDPPRFWGPSAPTASDDAVSLLKKLLRRHPRERATATEALHSAWIGACVEGNHMLGTDLPSLRPVLSGAKNVGAFDLRRADTEKYAGDLLGQLQVKYGQPQLDPSPGIAPVVETQTQEMVEDPGPSSCPPCLLTSSAKRFDSKKSSTSNSDDLPSQVCRDPSSTVPHMWTSVVSVSTHASSSTSRSTSSPCQSPLRRQTSPFKRQISGNSGFQRHTSPFLSESSLKRQSSLQSWSE